MKMPKHIAFIMDGNGRWGVKKYNNRIKGHEFGVKNILKIVKFFLNKKIKNLSLYALSYDNLRKRNRHEIKNLFFLFEKYLNQNIGYFVNNRIKLSFVGEKEGLSKKINLLFQKYEDITKFKKPNLLLNIFINYSSRLEILKTMQIMKKKNIKINVNNFDQNHYLRDSKDPCLIIRTGSYSRLSDFLLWQSSYSELFFLKKLWPDFNLRDLEKIIKKFNLTKRNFGK